MYKELNALRRSEEVKHIKVIYSLINLLFDQVFIFKIMLNKFINYTEFVLKSTLLINLEKKFPNIFFISITIKRKSY